MATDVADDTLPALSLFDAVAGQGSVVEFLRRAAREPVHAYLFTGPAGTGKRAAALAFAAALLCPEGGCGHCRTCRLARAGTHIDVEVIERVGASIDIGQAKGIVARAALSPNEGSRKILVLVDFHLADRVAPAILKTLEEPPPSTVFVVLADTVPPELVTIASRCVQVAFPPLTERQIAESLTRAGVAPAVAEDAARASGGRLDRAQLLAADPDAAARRQAWAATPARLDGTGAAATVLAAELLEGIQRAGAAMLEERHARESAELEEQVKALGERAMSGARKALDERQKREVRRVRADELRAGLATLAAAYRDRAAAAAASSAQASSARNVAAALDAAAAIHAAGEALERNPNEMLLLQALFIRLQPLAG